MLVAIARLRWEDLEPTHRGLDASQVRAIAEVQIGGLHSHGIDRHAIAEALDRALVAELGAWVAGWDWATSEPGGGGPVRAWCCARDSLFRTSDVDASASVDRVVAAVGEWHAFLVELAATFDALQSETGALPLEQSIERAAARLLPMVVARTESSDAWYRTFATVVSWYAQACGHEAAASSRAIATALSGRFHSWTAPDAETARAVCADIGLELAITASGQSSPRDALETWRAIRSSAFARPPAARRREPVRVDGHERFIEAADRARDPQRADRLRTALAACRASARRGERLSLDRLESWNALVLGEPATLRSTDAHAKGRRERYGIDGSMHAELGHAIAEATDRATSTAVRASRIYLDVCFFHPFVDGNARTARLALDFVLTREGLALHAAEPVFSIARDATDADGAWSMALLLEHVVGPRAVSS